MTIRPFYDRWPQYQRRLTEAVSSLTDDQLGLRPSPDQWPVWAIVAHVAGARVYWLCGVLGEGGAVETPWPHPLTDDGWEDDLDHPRSAAALVGALDASFAIIDRALDHWTPEMLDQTFERSYGGRRQDHSRASVLQRLLTHEAYHGGEVSQILGQHGFDPVYIWAPYE